MAAISGLRLRRRSPGGVGGAVLAAPGRQVGSDLALGHGRQVGLGGEPGVAGDLFELAPQVGLGLVDQGDERGVVGRIGRQRWATIT